jgi:Na+/H+ antiporter NhaD/arsenite permease-like protein
MEALAPYPGNAPAQRGFHSQKTMTITWGYYFRTGIIMTLPVLL